MQIAQHQLALKTGNGAWLIGTTRNGAGDALYFSRNFLGQGGLSIDPNGDGDFHGRLGVGTATPQSQLEVITLPGNYGITHSDGTVKVATYVGGSSSGANGGWIRYQSRTILSISTLMAVNPR